MSSTISLYLAVLAAHDARQAHGPGLVGDDQHGVGEVSDVAVQGGELLAVLRPADDDLAALHIAVVKGVHGLAVFQHDVVGDVHDVVDGPHPGGPQPLPHPQGRGADLYVPHHPGGVPGAQVRGGGLHVQQLGQDAGAAALHHGVVEGQGLAEGDGRLPGQADDGQAVRPVGGDLKLHHVVVEAQDLPDIVSGLEAPGLQVGVGLQDKDAVHHAGGPVVVGHAQLLVGAQHPVGFHAPELALLDMDPAGEGGVVLGHGDQVPLGDVLGAGDDLDGLGLAHVHLADPHMVGVLVADDLQDLAHHHIGNLFAFHLGDLHLGAGEGHVLGKLLVGGVHGDKFIEPSS